MDSWQCKKSLPFFSCLSCQIERVLSLLKVLSPLREHFKELHNQENEDSAVIGFGCNKDQHELYAFKKEMVLSDFKQFKEKGFVAFPGNRKDIVIGGVDWFYLCVSNPTFDDTLEILALVMQENEAAWMVRGYGYLFRSYEPKLYFEE